MKYEIIKYHPSLKPFSRKLRKESTLSEILLWDKLKNKQLFGYKFLRQKPIDNFIVDFFCKELMLAIEIDGSSHNEKVEQDLERQMKIENLGIKFLRFQDKDVRFKMNDVLITIEGWIKENSL
ncbi:MAG: endonuclease domain-containing protein [Bacteroidetes bacterium]|nr:endonuclease domain-containing protein [Bacteroidota bacterium]